MLHVFFIFDVATANYLNIETQFRNDFLVIYTKTATIKQKSIKC